MFLIKSKKGFSLIEVIITFVLIVVFCVLITAIATYAKKFNIAAKNRCEATQFLAQSLEMLSELVYGDPQLDIQTTDMPLPASTVNLTDTLRDNFGGTRSYTVTENSWDQNNANTKYKQIQVTVKWTENGVDRSLSLTTIRKK